jgi:hypothetical protein
MRQALHYKKRRFVFYTALFFMGAFALGQQPYFQQEVNYKIEVALNDTAHTLSAFQRIQYINNSSQSLDFIYFHLWPNAYKNNNTALARQLLEQNRTALYFSKPEERGYIDSLDFKVNGKPVVIQYDAANPDICKLVLNEPLRSLDTLEITTPFFVKIPDAKFSRLGHTGQAYFITQWYPKPAVFDQDGWHPMPYLDQGEFYSEFGSFDVSVTLPQNYVLAATGDRIDAGNEETFLNNKVIETLGRMDQKDFRAREMEFPASSKAFKTIRFKQYRVHDFAWFADKRFNVIHDQIELPGNKRTVDTWVFFTNKNFELWKDAVTYVNESTIFYSSLNGDYPYNHVTAVDGTIMAGGGMEYPNITVIGDMDNAFDLDVTIAHEVGHNWFYGILGSNERDYPFMDEGINSFYEMRYVRAKYPLRKLSEFLGRDSTFRLLGLNKTPFWREKEFTYYLSATARMDQPILLPSPDFTSFNYGSIVYGKTPVVLDYLMDYMGEETFDKAMKFYYEQFRFKHPTPGDFIKTMSYFSGKDLDWFRNYLLKSTAHLDYKIKKVKRNADSTYTLTIRNKTGVPGPINIYGFKNNKPVGLVWYDGFDKTRTVTFPPAEVDYFKIDGLDRMPDLNRKNNVMRTRGLFKKAKPLQFNLLTKLDNPRKTQVNYLPVTGANLYNGFMLGAALHNYGFYPHRFEYLVAPMYAFKSKTPTGFAELNYNLYPKKTFRQITIGVKAKSFAYDYFETRYMNERNGTSFSDLYLHYYKIAPYIELEVKKKKAVSPTRQLITYSNTNLFTDSLDLLNYTSIAAVGPHKKNVYSFVNTLSYQLNNHRAIDPFRFQVSLQHTASMAKLSATFHYQFTLSRRHFIEVRAFAGSFIAGNANERGYYSFRTSGYKGSDDYLFDGNFVARNELVGLGYSQFMEQDGNLKVPVLFGYASQWMAAVNIKSPQLFRLPLKLFADFALSDDTGLRTEKQLWDAGINLTLARDIIEVYVPLAYSNDIRETLELNNIGFLNTVRFTFNIHRIVARDLIKNNFTE